MNKCNNNSGHLQKLKSLLVQKEIKMSLVLISTCGILALRGSKVSLEYTILVKRLPENIWITFQ